MHMRARPQERIKRQFLLYSDSINHKSITKAPNIRDVKNKIYGLDALSQLKIPYRKHGNNRINIPTPHATC